MISDYKHELIKYLQRKNYLLIVFNIKKYKSLKKRSRNFYLNPNVSGEFLHFSMEKKISKKKNEKKVASSKI